VSSAIDTVADSATAIRLAREGGVHRASKTTALFASHRGPEFLPPAAASPRCM
jgi:IMP dehydrogenase/GMP reductase